MNRNCATGFIDRTYAGYCFRKHIYLLTNGTGAFLIIYENGITCNMLKNKRKGGRNVREITTAAGCQRNHDISAGKRNWHCTVKVFTMEKWHLQAKSRQATENRRILRCNGRVLLRISRKGKVKKCVEIEVELS